LTLTTGTPVMAVSATAQTTLYYDCYQGGNLVSFFTGSADVTETISGCEVSTAMQNAGASALSANGVFDVWWVHSGANRICVATNGSGGGWASDTGGGSNTARGTGYSQLDTTTRPYITNKNALANCYNGTTNYGSVTANQATYLGTICTDAAAAGTASFTYGTAASGGGTSRLCVWNAYNRVNIGTSVQDSGGSYTYTTATIRQARGTTTDQITFVFGQQEDAADLGYIQQVSTIINGFPIAGIGIDSTVAITGAVLEWFSSGGVLQQTASTRVLFPGLGLHVAAALEKGDGANANTINSGPSGSVLNALIRM
jgi:hypothetical protein